MAISSGIPKCPYCGERVPTISDKPFDGRIYPDYEGHNKTCKNHLLNKQNMNTNNEAPRRNRIDLFTPAEKAIYDAMHEVEKMPADTRLTEAVILLDKARERVAIFAAYWGAQVWFNNQKWKVFNGLNSEYIDIWDSPREFEEGIYLKDCSLLLRSIESLTDEEAVEVAKIINRSTKYSFNVVYVPDYTSGHNYLTDKDYKARIIRTCDDIGNQYGYIVIDMAEQGFNKMEVVDYLRSKGYNIGYGSYSAQDLIDAGVVIIKN